MERYIVRVTYSDTKTTEERRCNTLDGALDWIVRAVNLDSLERIELFEATYELAFAYNNPRRPAG